MPRMFLARYVTPYVTCPMCRLDVSASGFLNHILDEHPYFFVVWASFNMPNFHTEALLTNPDGVEDASYEFLSELCDRMGYHRVGVKDVDDISEYVCCDEDDDVTCPICLDNVILGRKIILCEHTFCSSCIEKWLSDHKTCPVCIRDLSVQIASTSTSLSASGPSSPSSINTT